MIRLATDADAALVRELWHAFNVEVPDLPWREDDEDEFHPDLVLLSDDDGVVALSRLSESGWFVDLVYVRPEARGSGVGTALLRGAAEHVGDATLELEVLESNADARRLYERLGFQTVERSLAAPAAALRRIEGATYGAVHVQNDDVELVRRNASKVLRREPEVTAAGDWTRVDAAPGELRNLARELSFTTGVSVALTVESGAVVRYILFDRGAMVDEYASVPEFHGPLPPGDVMALGANPTVVARLTGADAQRVREVARTAATPADLPPAEELYAQIADLLGVTID